MQSNVVASDEPPATATTTIPTTTATATATTTTMVIPTPIPATTSNDQNSKDSHHPTAEKAKDDEEDITASFTIIAPSAANRSRPSSLIVTAKTSTFAEEKEPQEEVTATFVMMTQRKESRTPTPTSRTHTPTENVETTIVITPSSKRLVEASITDDDKGKQQEEESSSSSSSSAADDDEVEDDTSSSGKADGSRDDLGQNENKTDKKTEPPPLETITPTSMPVSNTSTITTSKERSPTSQRAQSTERMRAAFFSPLSLTPATTTTTATTTTATTPTLESPVRLRDKRSLFDLDNASSHAMADRIRHETNRYGFDEKRAGNILTGELSTTATATSSSYMPSSVHESSTDRDSSMSPLFGNLGPISGMGYNYTAASRRSLDSSSASLPNSPLHSRERDRESGGTEANTGSSATSSNISAADRRPSWRLKFDAGSKVIHPYTNNIAKQETYTQKKSTQTPYKIYSEFFFYIFYYHFYV